jgi:DNA-binding NtrC family response regulator
MQLKVRNKNVAELIDKFVGDGVGIDSMMLRFRNSVIVRALTLTSGNITHAAAMLKTHRSNLERWLRASSNRESINSNDADARSSIVRSCG